MKEKLLTFFKKETILCIACLLAALSAYIVPPDAAYLGYVDTRVLILLFSLMAVLAGFRALGIFDRMANLLLAKAKKMRQLALTLVMLCFFSAMLVTNDVALITFVPFTILLLQRVHLEEKLIPVIVLQTIAANLGSMLTPVGNPQNLYLYTISGIGVGAFFRITLPFVLVSFFLLLLLCFLQGNTSLATQPQAMPPTRTGAEKQQLFGAVFSLPAGSFPHPARSAAVGVGTGVVSAVSKRDSERGGLLPAAHVCIFLYPDWESGTDFRHTGSPPGTALWQRGACFFSELSAHQQCACGGSAFRIYRPI